MSEGKGMKEETMMRREQTRGKRRSAWGGGGDGWGALTGSSF